VFSNKFHVTAVNTLLTSLEVAVDNWCLVFGIWCLVFHYHQNLTKLAVGQLLQQNAIHT
jgi:hypothetical protein